VRARCRSPRRASRCIYWTTRHVVLLARDGCNWGTDAESQALVVEIKQGKPSTAASLPVKGTIEASRLVGTALYVASSAYRKLVSTNTTDGGQWERGTQISSFDLSQPSQPAARSTEWYRATAVW